jgi:hypothetical protein
MENTKTISAIRMSNVIGEFTKRRVLWANVRVKRRSCRVGLGIEPVPIVVRTSGMIASKNIIWVSNPETGGCLIGIQQAP